MTGRIISVKSKDTATVLVIRTATHALYKKTFIRSKKYLAVDELGVKLGDIVEMVKVRPVSKRKHWKITKVVGRNVEELVSEMLQEKAAETIAEIMPASGDEGESLPDGKADATEEKIEEKQPKAEKGTVKSKAKSKK